MEIITFGGNIFLLLTNVSLSLKRGNGNEGL